MQWGALPRNCCKAAGDDDLQLLLWLCRTSQASGSATKRVAVPQVSMLTINTLLSEKDLDTFIYCCILCVWALLQLPQKTAENLQGLQKLPQTEILLGATLNSLLTEMKGFWFTLKNITLSTKVTLTSRIALKAEFIQSLLVKATKPKAFFLFTEFN